MKNIKYFFFLICLTSGFFLNSCDDAGQNPVFVRKGLISFTHINLKPLNTAIDGLYTLWLKLDSSGTAQWHNLGQFNIGQTGEIIDANGNPMVFSFNGDTNLLGTATKSTVTVGNDPEKSVVIGASLTVTSDSITGSFWMGDDLALGNAFGTALINGHYGKYMLQTPTDNNATCLKGLWLCDTLGNNVWPEVPDLPSGRGWIMEGWVNDESTNSFYSIGRFYSFNSADNDGAGSCKGPNGNGFNKPGQDWVQPGCPSGLPPISNLNNGNYGVFITIEPENESGASLSSPFPFKLFYHTDIGTVCKAFNWVYSQANLGNLPRGKIKITN